MPAFIVAAAEVVPESGIPQRTCSKSPKQDMQIGEVMDTACRHAERNSTPICIWNARQNTWPWADTCMRPPGKPSHVVTPFLRVIRDHGLPVLRRAAYSHWGRYRCQRLADSHLARAGLMRRVAYRKRETPGPLLAEDVARTIGRHFAHGSRSPEHDTHGTGSIVPGRVQGARVGDKGGLWPPRSGSGRRGGASAYRLPPGDGSGVRCQ
jgi:hypothetical protein